MNPTIEHEINEWTNRNGQLFGASIFLNPEEACQFRNDEPIQIAELSQALAE